MEAEAHPDDQDSVGLAAIVEVGESMLTVE